MIEIAIIGRHAEPKRIGRVDLNAVRFRRSRGSGGGAGRRGRGHHGCGSGSLRLRFHGSGGARLPVAADEFKDDDDEPQRDMSPFSMTTSLRHFNYLLKNSSKDHLQEVRKTLPFLKDGDEFNMKM